MSSKENYLAVTSNSFSLYEAFKKECEQLGWKYIESFTKFNEEEASYVPPTGTRCLFFSQEFAFNCGKPGFSKPRFSISNTTKSNVYKLPQQWDEALKAARELMHNGRFATVILNKKYNAVIDNELQTVTVGCQTIPFIKVQEIVSHMKKSFLI